MGLQLRYWWLVQPIGVDGGRYGTSPSKMEAVAAASSTTAWTEHSITKIYTQQAYISLTYIRSARQPITRSYRLAFQSPPSAQSVYLLTLRPSTRPLGRSIVFHLLEVLS